jgi:hypothetical protein
MFSRRFSAAVIGLVALAAGACPLDARDGAGPFAPHPGMKITTVFANEFGRDAEATTVVDAVTPEMLRISYLSTRGLFVKRDVLVRDRQAAHTYVLGYAARMPEIIEGSTSLGLSQAVLEELRTQGGSSLVLIYSDRLDRIDCRLTTTGIDVKVPVIVEDQVFDVPTIQARAVCGSGNRSGRGSLVFANDLANPVLIESILDFSWERQTRTERVTRVTAGSGLHRDMVQSLRTLGAYDVYGLHFDFDSANLRPETAQLVREIAQMLRENPKWVLQIAGHTDSVGGQTYNLGLSQKRSEAIRAALIGEGIAPQRLVAIGYGMDRPKADNSTMSGRAINRRAEFRRLDR